MSRDALVVGIDVYDQLPGLTSPSTDANDIARLLVEYGDFEVTPLPGIKNPDNDSPWIAQVGQAIRVTCAQVEDALIRLFLPQGKSIPDTALFFFSGHGVRRDKGIQEGYLAASDVNTRVGNWGVSLQWLRRLLEESPVRQQVIWLDCCYSGELFNVEEADPGNRGKVRDRCFIAASREYEPAYEERSGTHGILSTALLDGLVPHKYPDRIVNNLTLTSSISRSLKGSIQRALFTNSGGQIMLTRSHAVEEVRPSVASGICPYKGLSFFDYTGDDPKYFFGREHLTDQLLEKVRSGNFVAVLGPSGSGKSSVVRAGLLHQLRSGHRLSGSEHWPIFVFQPGRHPVQNLAEILVDPTLSNIDWADQLDEIEERLHQGAAGLSHLVKISAREGRVVLVADQFEEVFTLCRNDAERQQFFECLLGALTRTGKQLCLVLSMRADFLGKCAEQEYAGLSKVIQEDLVTVIPMTHNDLIQAITKPAEMVGLSIESELVSQMIADVQDSPGSLPLLQDALMELWKQREDNCLLLSAYQRIGGVKETLAKRADTVYEHLSLEEQQAVRRIFVELTQLGEGTEDTRRRVRKQDLVTSQLSEALVNRVVQKLTDVKLIITSSLYPLSLREEGMKAVFPRAEKKTEAAVVDVAHEALIRYWPRLRQWIDESRDAIRFQRRLAEAAQHWEDNDSPPGLLWRSPDLDLLTQFHHEHEGEMTSLQKDFFHESVKTEEQEYVEKERLQRNEAIQRYQTLRTQSLFLADLARQENEKQNYEMAILLALEALPASIYEPERPYVVEAERQLYNGILLREQKVLSESEYPFLDTAFSPGGSRVVASSEGNTAHIWEVDTGRELRVLTGHTDWIIQGAFSFDGNRVITASWDDTGRLWEAESGKELTVFSGHKGPVYYAAFSPDGQRIVTASWDGTARVWETESGRNVAILTGHQAEVVHAAFSPDGRRIATASWDGTARIWEAESGRGIVTLIGHQADVVYVDFSPDGKLVVTASGDYTARVWDANSGKEMVKLSGHNRSVKRAAFSSTDSLVFTAADDYTVRVWRVFRDAQEMIDYAKHVVPRHLTREERKRYFLG